jgi:hypothetical protein
MGLGDFIKSDVTATGPLTKADFFKAVEAIKNRPPHPCSLGQHVVNPKALYRPGWYRCGSCGAPVEVKYPLSER